MRITIQTLQKKGYKIKDLAQTAACHRNTISRILKEDLSKAKSIKRNKPSELDRYKEYIEDKLEQNLSATRIFQDLSQEKSFNRSYWSVRDYVKKLKKGKQKVYMRLHTLPGKEAQVDFGYIGKTLDNNGKMRKTWVFCMKLSYSRLDFYCKTYDQRVKTFLKCHEKAFEYFKGVPETIKIDNLKAAILEASFYEPVYQRQYLAFSKHYNFLPIPCRVAVPTDKGKVESGIKYVENNFFKGKKFANEDDLDCQLKDWIEDICNVRIHGTTKKIPRQVFEQEEKQHLKPLPIQRFKIIEYATRKVRKDCHIDFENNYYSVPYRYIDDEVELEIEDKIIKIYYQNESIAVHSKIMHKKGQFQTNKAHYPEYKIISETEYQKKYEEKMKEIGLNAHKFFEKTLKKYPYHWSGSIKGIVNQLLKTFEKEEIDGACKRALAYNAYGYRTIKRICESGLAKVEPDQIRNDKEIRYQEGEFLRPFCYYEELLPYGNNKKTP